MHRDRRDYHRGLVFVIVTNPHVKCHAWNYR